MSGRRSNRAQNLTPLTTGDPILSSSTSIASEDSTDSSVPLHDASTPMNVDNDPCPAPSSASETSGDIGYTGGMKISLPMTPPPSAGPGRAQFTVSQSNTHTAEESESEASEHVPTEPPPHYSAPATRLPQPHPDYYFDDGDVTFQVQDKLFRLHSFLLKRESTGAILKPERPLSGVHPNADPPIVLRVPVTHFEPFIRILYHPIYRPLEATLLDWVSVLALSTRWDFNEMRAMAISKIYDSPLCTVEKIQLAQTFHIPEWMHECYVDLTQRAEPLSFEEAEAVGVRVAIILHQARERIAKETTWFHTPDVGAIVKEIMGQ